jgi:hypothetical protein
MKIGFSTGSIALGDVRHGVDVVMHGRANAIELSALREEELDPLLRSLDALQKDLSTFAYISFHAPSRLEKLTESELVARLRPVAKRGWAIIVHPDIISDFSLWKELGEAVCIENMDKRKHIGSTASQLERIFNELPEATFCFDIGHAWQVDPTMQEAMSLLKAFGSRLRQVHMSYVNSKCRHERLNYESVEAYKRVVHWLGKSVPVILETPVRRSEVDDELEVARNVFACSTRNGERNPTEQEAESARTNGRD